MKQQCVGCYAVLLVLVAVMTATTTGQVTPQQLPGLIDQILDQPQFERCEWGIGIYAKHGVGANATYSPLYTRRVHQFFTPASNNKLLTCAATFVALPTTYTIKTPFYQTSHQTPALCVHGKGDAALTSAQLEEAIKTVATTHKHFSHIVADDSFFPTQPPSTWEWEDVSGPTYGSRPNALILDANIIHLTVSPSSLGHPAVITLSEADTACVKIINNAHTTNSTTANIELRYMLGSPFLFVYGSIGVGVAPVEHSVASILPAERFACSVAFYAHKHGVVVDNQQPMVQNCAHQQGLTVLATIESPQFYQTMNHTLQMSDNLFTETYLRTLGRHFKPTNPDAEHDGIQAVKEQLHTLQVNISSFVQVDGSGVSRRNLVSPQSLIETLIGIDRLPNASVFRSFLPVSGETGTLRNRMKGTIAQGRVFAKTGTVNAVTSLSGYLTPLAYDEIVFSMISNQLHSPASVARQAQDDICVLLTQLTK